MVKFFLLVWRACPGYGFVKHTFTAWGLMSLASDSRSLLARIGSRRPDFSGRQRKIRSSNDAARLLLERIGGREQGRLVQLWRNWSMVMGPDLAGLAIPLGSRKRVLIVGGEDNMAMQELTYQIPEMLERANAFMDAEHFDKIELRLLLGREALDTLIADADVPTGPRPKPLPPRPKRLGELLGQFDPESPVGRCYATYVRMFAQS